MKCTLKALTTFLAGAFLWSTAAVAATDRLAVTAPRYDQEYPAMDYSGPVTHNRIWRLKQQLDSGQLKLEWEPKWGYLRSVLRALNIDTDSQILVFSRTSLQASIITDKSPRAIYFNDDTYVAWVQGSSLLELMAVDANAGAVFFGLDNRRESAVQFEREGGRCLTCHDTYSMMGGGVPRILVMSAPVDDPADTRPFSSASEVDDRTPVKERWGGWYVTGRNGRQQHFGNMPLREDAGGESLRKLFGSRSNRDTLAGYFDTSKYVTDKSDIAALLVIEHQSFIQNLITRANYKVRALVDHDGHALNPPQVWADLDAHDRARVQPIVEPLVRALFLADAAPLDDRITSSSGFATRFAGVAPLDSRGRSLRQLDLGKRLFRYPLSYLVYSEHFDALPPYVLDYVDSRIAEVLQGRDTTGISARIDATDRAAISQILIDTKPRLAGRLRGKEAVAAHR